MTRTTRLGLSVTIPLLVVLAAGVAARPSAGPAPGPPPQWRLDVEAAMDAIGLQKGMIVGEAGAGTGYFTLPMARRVGTAGAVYANDISRRALTSLEDQARREGLANIHTVVGVVDDPLFPRHDLELVALVHALHDFDKPVEWLVNLKKYLRPGATVAVIDRDPEKGADSHFWPRDRIIGYATRAGYDLARATDGTGDHLILLFTPKPLSPPPAPAARRGGLHARPTSGTNGGSGVDELAQGLHPATP